MGRTFRNAAFFCGQLYGIYHIHIANIINSLKNEVFISEKFTILKSLN